MSPGAIITIGAFGITASLVVVGLTIEWWQNHVESKLNDAFTGAYPDVLRDLALTQADARLEAAARIAADFGALLDEIRALPETHEGIV